MQGQIELFNITFPDDGDRGCVEWIEANEISISHGTVESRIYSTMIGKCERAITGQMRGKSAMIPAAELAVAASALPLERAVVIRGPGRDLFYGETAPAARIH